MGISAAKVIPGRLAKSLAVLSVAGFWFLPASPLLAIAAVAATRGAAGWPRRAALVGAALCITHTLFLAAVVVALVVRLGWPT